jgi:hypothetical protein
MPPRPVVHCLLVLAALGANAASRAATHPIDAISGTLADRDAERFTRRGVVLDEHFRELASEAEAPPEPPPKPAADEAHRAADPMAAASSGASKWIAAGATSLLGAALVILLARRTRRRTSTRRT